MITDMLRMAKNQRNPNTGAIYYTEFSMKASDGYISGDYSNTYMLPVNQIYAIGVWVDGDCDIEITNAPEQILDAGGGQWDVWDKTSQINQGITAFRMKWYSGDCRVCFTVKTAGM